MYLQWREEVLPVNQKNSDDVIGDILKLLGIEKLNKEFDIGKMVVTLQKGKDVEFNISFIQKQRG